MVVVVMESHLLKDRIKLAAMTLLTVLPPSMVVAQMVKLQLKVVALRGAQVWFPRVQRRVC